MLIESGMYAERNLPLTEDTVVTGGNFARSTVVWDGASTLTIQGGNWLAASFKDGPEEPARSVQVEILGPGDLPAWVVVEKDPFPYGVQDPVLPATYPAVNRWMGWLGEKLANQSRRCFVDGVVAPIIADPAITYPQWKAWYTAEASANGWIFYSDAWVQAIQTFFEVATWDEWKALVLARQNLTLWETGVAI